MRLTMTVSLPQQPSSIGDARHILAVLLSLTSADDQARDDLAVLLTEACANVVQHGDTGTTIDPHAVIESGACVLEVGNRGRVPDGGRLPTRAPDPAQMNGRGLPLIALCRTARSSSRRHRGTCCFARPCACRPIPHPPAGDPSGP